MFEILEGVKRGARIVEWADVATYGTLAVVGIMGLALTVNRPFIRMIAEEVGKREVKHAAASN